VAAALWFVRIVVEPARLSRTLDVGVMGLVAAVLLAVAVAAVLGTRMSMVLVLVLTGFSLAAVAGTLAWGWVDGRDRNIRLVALAFLPVVLLALFPLARSFNLVPISIMTRNAIFFGTVLQMPILYYALQVRSVRRRESELRAAALSTTDPLTGLPHRPAFVERLNTTLTRARNHKHVFALFGVRAANLDAIAEEFGRDVAEKALVVAASHLRRVTTDTDMVARVGEQDFAMLLEGPLDNTIAVSRAQQVVASGLRQVDALPAAATLKFFVTVALLPHNSLDGLATLQWVQEALNQMTPDAKKLIRPLNF
jgi:diguanylate cyclase (GGDEF)-like protein